MTKTQKITYRVLLVLISIGFVAAAIPKLMGDPMAEAGFIQAHLPIWFMYFIGVAEICGVIGLWIKRLQLWAAGGLLIILVGAIVTTAIFQSVAFASLPLVYAIILCIIAWLGKKRTAAVPPAPIVQG